MDIALYIHVLAAGIALLAGLLAILLKKGSGPHKKAGYVFAASMIIMAVPAVVLSYLAEKPFDILSSVVTCYMVLTGLTAFSVIPKNASIALVSLAAISLAGYLTVEIGALMTGERATDAPAGAGYIFATVLGLAIWGDVRFLGQSISRSRQKTVIRHLWRMNFGLLLATASFFGARPHLFPDWVQSSGVLIFLTFAPVLVMGYWRFTLRKTS